MNGEGLLREDSLPTPSSASRSVVLLLAVLPLEFPTFIARPTSRTVISFHNLVIPASHTVHIGEVYFFRCAFGVLRSLNRWNPLSEVNFLDCSPRDREFNST
jgi:hypothetical protein